MAFENPEYYHVPENVVDPSLVAIGKGYNFFVLSPESTRAYVSSDALDPRIFASQHLIHFPVLAEDKMICVLQLFQVEGSEWQLEESCEGFTIPGCSVGGHLREYNDFLSVPEEYGFSDAPVSVVVFWAPASETWYMFPTPTGAHVIFFRGSEHFLDRTASLFKREVKRRWEEGQD